MASHRKPRPVWLRMVAVFLLLCLAAIADEQKEPKEKEYKPPFREGWVEIHSAHFGVITDAGEKRGREIALRLEQMQDVFADLLKRNKLNYPVPVQVLAVKNDTEYRQLAPLRNAEPITAPGFFLPQEDQYIIGLDLAVDEPWRAVTHPFTHMLLDGNYPPTQPWFDEGFAEYFSSIHVDDKSVELGADPGGNAAQSSGQNAANSLAAILSSSQWMSMADLLNAKPVSPHVEQGDHRTLFYAQSWIFMHYLVAKKMLPQVGTYFGLVQIRKLSAPDAFQQAFGTSMEKFEKQVKDYFRSLQRPTAAPRQGNKASGETGNLEVAQYPAPIGPLNVAMVVRKISDDDAQAVVADVKARQPEHRADGIRELQALTAEPMDNDVARRALGFAALEQKDFKGAAEQIQQVIEDQPKDIWARYYSALLRFKMQQAGQPMEGALANVQQNLRMVIDWDPQFAEAYHMLGLAEMEGGGTHAAIDTMRFAIQLAPRREWYVYNLAEIYMAGKKWDEAQPVLERLKGSSNPQIASAAKKKLEDLPFLKKYGIPPEQAATSQTSDGKSPAQDLESRGSDSDESTSADAEPKPKESGPDKRRVQHVKGKLVSVDCSHSPAATLKLSSAGRVFTLRTSDYKSLVLIGADQFSCDWRNQTASANYKAAGRGEGDLVSLEID